MKKILLFAIIGAFISSCAKMNDLHDQYLENGPTVYIGKVDSVKSFPGNSRIRFHYWISDPRAKSVTLYWGINNDSLVVPVALHDPSAPLVIDIDNIAEGNYSFRWITRDHLNNRSVNFENITNVYGDNYRSRLINRRVANAELTDDGVVISWAGSATTQEIGIEVTYKNNNGSVEIVQYDRNELSNPITLQNVDLRQKVTYRTLFVPEPQAIDTFYAAMAPIDIQAVVNVVQGKNVQYSLPYHSAGGVDYTGDKAVDGNITDNNSRWITAVGDFNEHWLEIDLDGEYAINSFSIWRASTPISIVWPRFSLQAFVAGEWADVVTETNYTGGDYSKDFPEVTTTKVRYYVPPYENNMIRLFEIAVYSITIY